jgi:hypothetical protein
MPWLYYETPADKYINNTEKVDFEVSFNPKDKDGVGRLEFFIAK